MQWRGSEKDFKEFISDNGMKGEELFVRKTGVSWSTYNRMRRREPVSKHNVECVLKVVLDIAQGSRVSKDDRSRLDAHTRKYFIGEGVPIEDGEASRPIEKPAASGAALERMVVYAKVLHLRDKYLNPAVYTKLIPGFTESSSFPIYDEVLVVRSLLFTEIPERWETKGQRPGIVDLQMIYPPRIDINEFTASRDTVDTVKKERKRLLKESVKHLDYKNDRLIQSVHPMVNCFQRGQEYIGSLVEEDVEHLVLVADLTSLPIDKKELFAGQPPTGELVRPAKDGGTKEQRLSMSVQEADTGMFILNSKESYTGPKIDDHEPWDHHIHRVKKDDKYYIRFPINWDAVVKAGGQKP